MTDGGETEAAEPTDEAIAACRAALDADPRELAPYRRLYRLQLARKAYDEAWCVASVLVFAGDPEPDVARLFEEHRRKGMPLVKARVDDEGWMRDLFHPGEELHVGKVFQMIGGAALAAKIEILKMKKELPVLPDRFRQDPATSKVTTARIFGWAAQVLGLPVTPQLYVRTDVPGALVAVAHEPPASVAGSTLLTGFSLQDQLFILGKHLAMYRGEHYVKTLFPTATELTVLFLAALRLVAPEAPCPPDLERPVAAAAPRLRGSIQPLQLSALRVVVNKLLAERVAVDVETWSRSVELTACRAGLLLSGDLETAAKILAAEPAPPGQPTAREKVGELMRWSVSQEYARLRRRLGIAVGG